MPSATLKTKPKHRWQFEAIGTTWLIESEQPLDDIKSDITRRIEAFDQTYSRFRDDSLVTKLAREPGAYEFPADAPQLLALYRALYDVTNGAVSPLIGGVLSAAGYDASYSLKPSTVTPAPSWDGVMQWEGRNVTTRQPLLLDFGAAGKGYLVDLLAGIMEYAGHRSYVIDASGDICARGEEQMIGLENPHDPTMVIGAAKVSDSSICASATNRRRWGDWHHVVDPRTATPVSDVAATWVVAPTTMVADGLATALFFVSADKLHQWDFAYVRLMSNGTIERSAYFVGELYI